MTFVHLTFVQAVVTKVTADYDRWTLMEANEPLIVQLQACWRGALVRKPFRERMGFLRDHKEQAVTLQAHWKGYRQRNAYKERLEFLKQQAAVAVKVQGERGEGREKRERERERERERKREGEKERVTEYMIITKYTAYQPLIDVFSPCKNFPISLFYCFFDSDPSHC